MIKIATLMAVFAVAAAAPGFVGTGAYAHGPHLFPGQVEYGAGPAIVKANAYGALPVAPIAYASPAIVKSAVVAPAPIIATPAVIKTPIVGSYGYGGHLGGLGGHLGGHLGGFGGHFIH